MHVGMKHSTGSKSDHDQQSLNFSWAFYICYCPCMNFQEKPQTRHDPIGLTDNNCFSDMHEIQIRIKETLFVFFLF